MLNKNIKIGSYVRMRTGSDKGKIGKVISLKREKNLLIVKGINLHSRHLKPLKDKEGKIQPIELPVSGSTIELVFP